MALGLSIVMSLENMLDRPRPSDDGLRGIAAPVSSAADRSSKAEVPEILDPWPPNDPLGEALHFLRMSGAFYGQSEFTAPWGITLPPTPGYLWFHVLSSGRCWLEAEGAEPLLLQAGDFTLVPRGDGHRLLSDPDAPAPHILDLEREQVSERYEVLRHGGGGAPAKMICGAVRFDHPAGRNLIRLLPRTLHIEAANSPHLDWLHSTLRFMGAEARERRPGGESVITRLADVLVILAIRAWIENAPAARAGWLGALRDPQIGRALTLVHRDPSRDWTVASLAGEVAMSRSAFAARFSEMVGEPAMRYVTRWRMQLALGALEEGGASVKQLAARLGYDSEAAFSRAFKRVMGVSPGRVRRRPELTDLT